MASKRLIRPDLDIGKTVQKISDKISGHVEDRTRRILEGDLTEGEYREACGYVRAFNELQQMIVDAFTFEAAEEETDVES